jgi:K+-sensing histidine kinase KdpD
VQVGDAVVRVRMPHHAAVRHYVHVVVLVCIRRAAVVHVAMVMKVIMLAAMFMGGVVSVRMPVRGSVLMHVLVVVAFDLRFAAAAAAGCAHVCSPRRRLRRRRAAPKPSDSPLGGQRMK